MCSLVNVFTFFNFNKEHKNYLNMKKLIKYLLDGQKYPS